MNCTPVFKRVSASSSSLIATGEKNIIKALKTLAADLESSVNEIITENGKDLSRMPASDPRYDRLLLTPARIKDIAMDVRKVSALPDPAGRILDEKILPNGLNIKKISVPFGVVGVIFESRPNVVIDVFSLCLRSRNACILKGGSDARDTNAILVKIVKSSLEKAGINSNIIELLPPGRKETAQMLTATRYIDLVIPRGSRGLIDFVRENAKVPVIETGAGICHTYFDRSGDLEKGSSIIHNAKTRRISVCNALDCLIIHEDRLNDLPALVEKCAASGVIIYADPKSLRALRGKYPDTLLKKAVKDSFGTEFLSLKMAVKTVPSFDKALSHIAEYGSKHSEAIIAEDKNTADLFLKLVDASSVYSNTSTAFTDGSQFGLGAEIGISTQKLHARGPMALEELTSYKWVIEGNGQVRK